MHFQRNSVGLCLALNQDFPSCESIQRLTISEFVDVLVHSDQQIAGKSVCPVCNTSRLPLRDRTWDSTSSLDNPCILKRSSCCRFRVSEVSRKVREQPRSSEPTENFCDGTLLLRHMLPCEWGSPRTWLRTCL